MSEPIEIEVAAWVRLQRARVGMTRDDLAGLAGYSVSVVERIEEGSGGTRLSAVGSVVEALGGRLEVRDAATSTDADTSIDGAR